MDLFSCVLYLLVLSLSFSLLTRYLYTRQSNDASLLPPGRKGWPFIGEAWQFFMAGPIGNPQRFLKDRMNKHSPDVFQTSWLGENLAVFCGVSGNKFVFSGENKCVRTWSPPWFSRVYQVQKMRQSSHEFRIRKRGIILEFLKPESLQSYIPLMDSTVKQHLETDWSPYKEVKVYPLSTKYTFALACMSIMGIEDPDYINRFVIPFGHIVAGHMSLPINLPGTAYNRALKGGEVMFNEIMECIKRRKIELLEKREREATDMLSRMIVALIESGPEGMNETETAVSILGLLVGSHSTSIPIAFVIHYLAQHPQVYHKVLQEQMEIARSKGPGELLNWKDIQKMKYTWCVACETLRLAPPLGQFREAITDFSYAGFTIPKGWKIYWSPHTTHKNPEYFPDPERFDPSRFEGNGSLPYAFVPFGGGPRMCPGKEYARLVILVFMHNVVTKFKWEKVIPNEKIKHNISAPFPMNGLPIRLEPHKI